MAPPPFPGISELFHPYTLILLLFLRELCASALISFFSFLPKKQNRRKSLRPAADLHHTAIRQPSAGGESSFGDKPRETFAVLAPWANPSQGRPRKNRRPSGQVAETPPNASRVRFEFAGRAHCREFTPNSVINLPLSIVNMKSLKNSLFLQKLCNFFEVPGSPPLYPP